MGSPRNDKIRERGTITFTQANIRDMEKSIANNDFKTVTELVNTALRYYFDNSGTDIEAVVKDLFEKGKLDVVFREAVEGVVVEILEEKKKKTSR